MWAVSLAAPDASMPHKAKRISRQKRYLTNLLGSLSLAMMDDVEAAVEDTTGFAGEASAILVTIGSEPGRSIGFVARVVGLSHSGAVRTVDKLQKEGLIAKCAGRDARTSALSLTPKGRRRMKQVLAAREAALVSVLHDFSADELTVLSGYFGRLLKRLTWDDVRGDAICRLCDDAVCRSIGCPVDDAVKLF